MNEDQKQRLKEVRITRGTGVLPWSHLSSPQYRFEVARDTIDFLLSLIDSEAANGSPEDDYELVEKMNDAAESLVRDWYCDSQHREELVDEIAVTLTAAHRRAEANAAAAMRDLCVEKVKETAQHYDGLAATEYDQPAAIASVLRKMAYTLESLTLDQVEQKQK